MSIKPPSSQTPSIPSSVSETAAKTSKNVPVDAKAPLINPEAIAQALQTFNKLKKLKKSPLSAGLFGDNIVFPSDLLDTNNVANDPSYLHLLSAMLGIKPLEEYFSNEEQLSDAWEDDEDGAEGAG